MSTALRFAPLMALSLAACQVTDHGDGRMTIRPDWQRILASGDAPSNAGASPPAPASEVVYPTGTPRWTVRYLVEKDGKSSCDLASTEAPRMFVAAIKGTPLIVAGLMPESSEESIRMLQARLRVDIDGKQIGIDGPSHIGMPLVTVIAFFRLTSLPKMEAFWTAFNRGSNLQVTALPPVDYAFPPVSLRDSRLAYLAMRECIDKNF